MQQLLLSFASGPPVLQNSCQGVGGAVNCACSSMPARTGMICLSSVLCNFACCKPHTVRCLQECTLILAASYNLPSALSCLIASMRASFCGSVSGFACKPTVSMAVAASSVKYLQGILRGMRLLGLATVQDRATACFWPQRSGIWCRMSIKCCLGVEDRSFMLMLCPNRTGLSLHSQGYLFQPGCRTAAASGTMIRSMEESNESEVQSSCRGLRGLTRATPRTQAFSSGLVVAVIR